MSDFADNYLLDDPKKYSRLTDYQTIAFVLLLKYFQILNVYS